MQTTEKNQRRKILIINIGVIIMLILIAISNVVFAQPTGGQQGPPSLPNTKQIKKMVANLAKEISLDEKQEDQVLAIYQGHFADVKKATSSDRPDRSEMEKLKTELETAVEAVLTEEQQEKFAAYLKEQEKKQRRGRPELL